ncbi:MAG: S8 family serine peptidase [Kiritimatiellia bacterium]
MHFNRHLKRGIWVCVGVIAAAAVWAIAVNYTAEQKRARAVAIEASGPAYAEEDILPHSGGKPSGGAGSKGRTGPGVPTKARGAGEKGEAGSKAYARDNPDFIPDELLLSFADSEDRARFISRAEDAGVEVLDKSELRFSVRIRLPEGMTPEEAALLGPEPLEWGANYYVLVPEPPGGNRATDAGVHTAFGAHALKWLGVEKNGDWGKGVTVAVLDTGVSVEAGIPAERVTRVKLSGGVKTEGESFTGHGTAVASLILGAWEEIAGIAPASDVLSIEVLSDEGVGDAFTVAKGIVEAVERGADVINLCLGTYGDNYLLKEAVTLAWNRGIPVVAAVGNDSAVGVCYPAGYENVVGVTAVDAARRHPYFANIGADVDISAPGLGLLAAWTGDENTDFSGTSAAAPLVSGMLAMLLGSEKVMSGEKAVSILLANCDDAGAGGRDDVFGEGVLNAQRVVERDVEGIYDVAAGDMRIVKDEDAGEYAAEICLQNRGTERVGSAVLEVEIEGVWRTAQFFDIEKGETMTAAFPVDMALYDENRPMRARYRAVLQNEKDSRPENNARDAVVLVPEEQ